MVLLTTDWIRPDILTIAKGLGKGIPIGACLTDKKLGHLLKLGLHGSTFGGNPLACRLAHTVLDFLEKQYLQNVADRGDKLLGLLPPLIMTSPQVEYLAQQISLLFKELSQNHMEL